MATGFRERRLGCRLYVDHQSDAGVVKKLDRMLMDGAFPNQTELMKRGIELAYEEVYEGQKAKALSNMEAPAEEIARVVVSALKPELERLLTRHEAKSSKSETLKEVTASTDNVSQGNTETASVAEAVLPSQTFSFLKGLNDD